ncbi:hypothetical protein [Clostridium tyrobutyricum]|uniref:hypothetical protein n=1 Tax=Clostridium tyrobutyricum TaxID=1519 RepID=UPI0010AA8445|nr:hypothetical protein [Clostridium tyrobutyricum]QCH28451.1 hypothetical protein EZN00_02055 [Clostridium tyrobutyricum]
MANLIDFKTPRQREWGILSGQFRSLTSLNYGGVIDKYGNPINSYSTNCYKDALEQAKKLIATSGTDNIYVVEFVPYDYMMQPNV